MVNILSFVLTIVFASSVFSAAIPTNGHKHRPSSMDINNQLPESTQTLTARDPNWLSLGKKLVKEGAHIAKSKKGRKVLKKVAKGAFSVAENY